MGCFIYFHVLIELQVYKNITNWDRLKKLSNSTLVSTKLDKFIYIHNMTLQTILTKENRQSRFSNKVLYIWIKIAYNLFEYYCRCWVQVLSTVSVTFKKQCVGCVVDKVLFSTSYRTDTTFVTWKLLRRTQ